MHARALTIFVVSVTIGCAEEPSEPVVPDTSPEPVIVEHQAPVLELTESQRSGKQLYDILCWTCHGPTGRGDGPLPTRGSALIPPSFMEGRYPGMSASDLEARFADVDSLRRLSGHMRYVESIVQPDAFREALSYVPALIYPSEIPGSAINGSLLYAHRCRLCHGETGQGEGELGMTLMIRPADFTKDTLLAQRNWEGLFLKIQTGGQGSHTAMPHFGSFFSQDELWDLVAYISLLHPGLLPTLTEAMEG